MSSFQLSFTLLLVGATLLPTLAFPPSENSTETERGEYESEIQPFFAEHCFGCHGESQQKGGMRLDTLAPDFTNRNSTDKWLEVIEMLGTGEMPPEDPSGVRAQPAVRDSARIVQWLAAQVEGGRVARFARRELVSFQRLTREEYAYTIEDLLGVTFDVSDSSGLHEDDDWRGFKRIGSALSVSASHVENYLEAAEAILEEAYPATPSEPTMVRFSALDLAGGSKSYGTERLESVKSDGRLEDIRADLWPGQDITVHPGESWNGRAGLYRFRVQVSGLRSEGGHAAHLSLYASSVDRLLFESDVVSDEAEPLVLEFDAHLPAGEHAFRIGNEARGPSILTRVGRAGPFFSLAEGYIPWQLTLTNEENVPLHPLLILDWVEVWGPQTVDRSLTGDRFLTAERELPNDPIETRARLTAFARQAFRRPLRPGEIDPYLALIENEREAGADSRSAFKSSLLAILNARSFLYLEEGSPTRAGEKLSAWELASRLSYFLWSSLPDEELLMLAGSGQLLEPEILKEQLTRLLADPKASRFAESFPRQWLQLDRVGKFTPNKELYPKYDKHLERSMVWETTSFFGEVLTQDLSIREFLSSDWTMLNPRLALHYDIPGVEGAGFRRVPLKADQHRGGILTHASVLSLTSDGTRHRPVHRGVWLSESILGQYPPSPPANVEPIEPTPVNSAKATVRMQLDAHRTNPACSSCHRKIDPYGLAFDNYDAVGRWRTEEVVPTGTGANPAVDASGVLPDGRAFSSPREFQALLDGSRDSFASAFIEKLGTYALRRPMGVDDRAALERIAAQSSGRDYRLREVIQALVLSDLFVNR